MIEALKTVLIYFSISTLILNDFISLSNLGNLYFFLVQIRDT